MSPSGLSASFSRKSVSVGYLIYCIVKALEIDGLYFPTAVQIQIQLAERKVSLLVRVEGWRNLNLTIILAVDRIRMRGWRKSKH